MKVSLGISRELLHVLSVLNCIWQHGKHNFLGLPYPQTIGTRPEWLLNLKLSNSEWQATEKWLYKWKILLNVSLLANTSCAKMQICSPDFLSLLWCAISMNTIIQTTIRSCCAGLTLSLDKHSWNGCVRIFWSGIIRHPSLCTQSMGMFQWSF